MLDFLKVFNPPIRGCGSSCISETPYPLLTSCLQITEKINPLSNDDAMNLFFFQNYDTIFHFNDGCFNNEWVE